MAKNNKASSKGAMGCLILFCLPFSGVGVFMLYLILSTFFNWNEMQSWTEVPATLKHVELISNYGSDSTTYKVEASYEYDYVEDHFVGDRVSLSRSSDNIGSFHQNTYSFLKKHQSRNIPVPCYVNHENPTESILIRKMRIEMLGFYSIFAIVFGGVGFGLMFAGFWGLKKERKEEKIKTIAPKEPWKWKTEWENGKIKSDSKGTMVASIIFSLFWNLISSPILFILPDELDDGNKAALIALIFPVVGVFLLIWAIYSTLRWVKYGGTVFEMSRVPGVIGGKLEGKVITKVNVVPENGFEVTLRCVRRVTRGSGKNRSTTESILFDDKRVITEELYAYDQSFSAIPVLFHIPFGEAESNSDDSDDQVIWRLEAKAETRGVDFYSQFEVPVFKTSESSPDFKLDERSIQRYTKKIDYEGEEVQKGILLEERGDELFLKFRMCRNLGTCFSLLIFFIIWTAVVVGICYSDAPILFPIVFGFFDLILAWAVWEAIFRSSSISIIGREVIFYSGYLGLGKKVYLRLDQIKGFEKKRGMQSGNQIFWTIQILTKLGKRYKLGSGIVNSKYADFLCQKLENRISL